MADFKASQSITIMCHSRIILNRSDRRCPVIYAFLSVCLSALIAPHVSQPEMVMKLPQNGKFLAQGPQLSARSDQHFILRF
jgi:hypothetical protein